MSLASSHDFLGCRVCRRVSTLLWRFQACLPTSKHYITGSQCYHLSAKQEVEGCHFLWPTTEGKISSRVTDRSTMRLVLPEDQFLNVLSYLVVDSVFAISSTCRQLYEWCRWVDHDLLEDVEIISFSCSCLDLSHNLSLSRSPNYDYS